MGNSYVKVFNKLCAEMALVDSFYPSFWSTATFLSRQIWPLCFFLSVRHLFSSSFFSIFFHQPIGIVGLAAVVAHVPDCFLGQTSRSKPGKKMEGKIWWRESERGGGERILQHYRASSIIQMAAVPLHLFSLLGLNIKMAAPKETDIQKMKPTQRAKAECT